MATEETEAATPEAAVVEAKGNSLLKAVGTVTGLFVMLLVTQLAAPILGCKLLNSATPNCPAPVVEVEEKGKAKKPAKPKGPPLYLPMDPPLVASLDDKGAIRFLQVTVEILSHDKQVIADLTTHMPVIRNNLLMLLGSQPMSALTNREDKEKLRTQSLAEVRKILDANPGEKEREGEVDDLYFTSFVVQ